VDIIDAYQQLGSYRAGGPALRLQRQDCEASAGTGAGANWAFGAARGRSLDTPLVL
jgi:hypothetical protein